MVVIRWFVLNRFAGLWFVDRFAHKGFRRSLIFTGLPFARRAIRLVAVTAKKTGDKTLRSLGRFKSENDAAKFVEALYQTGAVEVIVSDIYRNKARDQFADCLLVQLPRRGVKRGNNKTLLSSLSLSLQFIRPVR